MKNELLHLRTNRIEHMIGHVADHSFSSADHLFLDTNVWLWIYGRQLPPNAQHRSDEDRRLEQIYSDAYSMIEKSKSKVYINTIVISEFLTNSMRKEFGTKKLKIMRNREDKKLKETAAGFLDEVRYILERENCYLLEEHFSTKVTDGLLAAFDGSADYNDLIIARTCGCNGLTLITQDSDFKNQRISILTANEEMIS